MKKVLIADDSHFILDRLQQMLFSMEDVEVVGAFQNGTDALNALHELKPDLAILDNKMPGIKGIDIIREIRKVDSKVKLMLLTFYADTYYRQQAMKAGADYFFSKNEDFENIPEVIMGLKNNRIT
jgi:DNA-binding NarL/FixJ family response regulator